LPAVEGGIIPPLGSVTQIGYPTRYQHPTFEHPTAIT
jgi:hypothetical protein